MQALCSTSYVRRKSELNTDNLCNNRSYTEVEPVSVILDYVPIDYIVNYLSSYIYLNFAMAEIEKHKNIIWNMHL